MRKSCQLFVFVGLVSGIVLTPGFSVADESVAVHEKRQVLGWTVFLNPALKKQDPVALQTMLPLLQAQLKRIVQTVPAPAVTHLRKVPIWINPEYDGVPPKAEYHPSAGWLRDNHRDPAMARAVEITNVAIFPFENRRMPFLMLHELAHAYHDRVLGFDEPRVIATFELARDSGTYAVVKRFTGTQMTTDKAYALSNHKEYFAETTEAYFGRNDFYPFDRRELKAHDPQMFQLLKELWDAPQPSRQ